MKVLITGANGFIGKYLCEQFSEKNNVVGWDIFAHTYPDYEVIPLDMTHGKHVYNRILLDLPDLILHCAGSADVGNSILHPDRDYTLNVTVTHNLLFALKKAELLHVKIIFFSSAAVYGNPDLLPISETSQIKPISPYALHKAICEDLCYYFINNYHVNIKIVRIFSAYGPGLRKQIFWDMYHKAKETHNLKMFGTGNESRDYIYISDLLHAIQLISDVHDDTIIYNVANGIENTIREATGIFADYYGIPSVNVSFIGEKKEGNPDYWRADTSKLKALGYQQKVSLQAGICRYIDWVRSVIS